MPRVVLIFAEEGGFRSGGPFSQPISQLQNEATVLRNGTRVPKGCFAAAKHPVKLGYGCENWRFHALGISQLQNIVTVLQNGTRVPREGFAAAKIFAEGCVRLRNYFAMEGYFRSQPLISQQAPKGCEIISQQMAIFAGAYFGLRNFADH